MFRSDFGMCETLKKQNGMTILFLLEKEFKIMLRNRLVRYIVILLPLIVITIGPIITSQEVKDINVQFVDYDHSSVSRHIIQQISSSKYFISLGISPDYVHALKNVQEGNTDMFILIPRHFSRDRIEKRKNNIMIYANGVSSMKCGIGIAFIRNILTSQNDGIKNFISCTTVYNRKLDYKPLMIPALIVITIMMICGFFTMINIMNEKESGTVEQLRISPITTVQYLFSKMLPCWIIGVIVTIYCMLLSWSFYGIYPASITLTLFLSMLIIFFMCGLGAIVARYSRDMQQAVFLMWFVIICLFMIGGPFTFTEKMTFWFVSINITNPIECYCNAVQNMIIKDVDSIGYISKYFISPIISAILINILAYLCYKKK